MRKILDVLRLHHEGGRSHREIARAIHASPTTVGEILRRSKLAGLGYPLPAALSEAGVEALLYPPSAPSATRRAESDWSAVHRELRRKGVTLDLLWQEYKAERPDGYQYSSFCDHYRLWVGRLSVSLRQTHAPGEKLFVDYAGPTVAVTDPMTGEIRQAAIFVAVLGASNYTYCEATWSQALPDWIGSHVRTLEFIGGVPALLVPDNLKSGVKKACFYDPELNPTYRDLAIHYATAVLPARPYRPKDKAKVEAGVLLVERWVLAPSAPSALLQPRRTQSADCRMDDHVEPAAIQEAPRLAPERLCRTGSTGARSLPATRYEFADWKVATVGIDYHVEFVGYYYSVPYRFKQRKKSVKSA